MTQIIVILLCSMIFVPLVNLLFVPDPPKSPNAALIICGVAYLITLIFVLYLTFFVRGVS